MAVAMSRDVFRVQRIAPERAVFADVHREPRKVPAWLNRGSGASPGPEAQRGEPRRASSPPTGYSPSRSPSQKPGRGSVPPLASTDPYYERLQSESLAAEMRESWRAPAPATDTALVPEALEELGQRLVELDTHRRGLLRSLEGELLPLVRAIAERVIEREIGNDQGLSLRLIQEGLQALADTAEVSITLGPGFEDDAPTLDTKLAQSGIRASIYVDHSLPAYSCNLETPLGSVDESVETRLDNILSELNTEPSST